MGFGIVSLLNAVFRRMFTSAGLHSHTLAVDSDTTLHFWASPSLPPSSVTGDGKNTKKTTKNDTTKKKPVVVLIHGFGPDVTWQWGAQVGPLSRHFDLVVPDLIFFGASSTRSPLRSDAFQAAAIASLLTAHLAIGGRKVSVVGTSYGGLVAYHLARRLGGEVVERVVMCNADVAKGADDDRVLAAKGGVEDVTELMVPADGKGLRSLMALCVHRPPKYIPECLVRDLFRSYFADRREEKIQIIKGIATGNDGFQLTPLPQEVLIIWGEFDQIFPVEKAHKVKEKLGEKATLKIIANTGHLPHQEDSKQFNDIVLDFLLGGAK